MNVGESINWQTVASFLRGDLDHEDERTRAHIARACDALDAAAHSRLKAGTDDDIDAWFDHLGYVTTEGR